MLGPESLVRIVRYTMARLFRWLGACVFVAIPVAFWMGRPTRLPPTEQPGLRV